MRTGPVHAALLEVVKALRSVPRRFTDLDHGKRDAIDEEDRVHTVRSTRDRPRLKIDRSVKLPAAWLLCQMAPPKRLVRHPCCGEEAAWEGLEGFPDAARLPGCGIGVRPEDPAKISLPKGLWVLPGRGGYPSDRSRVRGRGAGGDLVQEGAGIGEGQQRGAPAQVGTRLRWRGLRVGDWVKVMQHRAMLQRSGASWPA